MQHGVRRPSMCHQPWRDLRVYKLWKMVLQLPSWMLFLVSHMWVKWVTCAFWTVAIPWKALAYKGYWSLRWELYTGLPYPLLLKSPNLQDCKSVFKYAYCFLLQGLKWMLRKLEVQCYVHLGVSTHFLSPNSGRQLIVFLPFTCVRCHLKTWLVLTSA